MSSEPARQPAAPRPLLFPALDVPPPAGPPRTARAARPEPARAPAAAVRREAEALAVRILADARQEAEELCARAADVGRREGWAAGRAEAERSVAELLAEARGLRARALRERRRLLAASVEDVAALALQVARRVLQREVEASPDSIVALARGLLQRVDGAASVRAHPDLAPVLDAEAGSFGRTVEVRADPAVAPGGLVLEHEGGVLDATLEGGLRRAAEALREGSARATGAF